MQVTGERMPLNDQAGGDTDEGSSGGVDRPH